jgi:hypothetical protein
MFFNSINKTLADTQASIPQMENVSREMDNVGDLATFEHLFLPKSKSLPFAIHAAPLSDEGGQYPTHTHGLADIGIPEFIMDPLAFGPEGNADKINRSYRYFKRNKKGLQLILGGQTVKLPIKRICPKWNNAPNYRLCFRKVTPEFEAVKLAYPHDIDPGTQFVQIYVDGDDYVLTDEYYRGGVRY